VAGEVRARRVRFPAPRQTVVEEVEVPAPGPGQARVRGEWSLISTGTEMTAYSGDFPREGSAWAAYVRYPFAPGYSAVGIVEAAGPGCALQPGQRVVSGAAHASCFLVDAPAEGGSGPAPAGRHPTADGLAVPAGVSPEAAAFHTLARIVMNGVRLGEPALGECAAVVGCGLLGQIGVRLLRLCGLLPVVAVDLARPRLERARASGADALLCPVDGDPVAALRQANAGRLADLVVDVTGAPGSFPLATRLARDLGRVVVLGSPRGPVTIDLHDDVHTRGLRVIGAHASTAPRHESPHAPWTIRRSVELFFELVARGRLGVEDLVTHRYPLTRAAEAYAMLDRDRTQAMGVLLRLDE
jgi:2-desacetyl-2-hydroxyethyl bacteriochlorophyllide A dehydrogenase